MLYDKYWKASQIKTMRKRYFYGGCFVSLALVAALFWLIAAVGYLPAFVDVTEVRADKKPVPFTFYKADAKFEAIEPDYFYHRKRGMP
jgi:hypothetical protein